ncbi:hypothetical protein METBIDRAFT_11280 [Metschnikowia bicuspidata var. bicuspidata NRRL YB-4993]|uniref:NDT80 domain-containing protein n=1 Tax=Metschnikowia bicuspidata var. bicuspidata NRRL YB-4993 TaxID=869754 RepID=A0A1A0HEW3_9ASCO|nr:hypothetical protein METBIDRAFT_11280 [Metschnikowia bicuspidata var. bicuspidata NRRL YB-4993]OBA22448.1 hypothetical protein METBIDRAFT_11280 [Metschnikowia bicuspidata var. bicuspidata NRRL YB-4993]
MSVNISKFLTYLDTPAAPVPNPPKKPHLMNIMSDKDQIDDFASLFLPDLLNGADSQDDPPLPAGSRDHVSPAASSTSSGSLLRFFEASQQNGVLAPLAEMTPPLRSAPKPIQNFGHVTRHVTPQNPGHVPYHVTPVPASAAGGHNVFVPPFHDPSDTARYRAEPSVPLSNAFMKFTTPGLPGMDQNLILEMPLDTDLTPTASSFSHNLLSFLSLDMGYMLHYMDPSLSEAASVHLRRPCQYPLAQFQHDYNTTTQGQYDPTAWASTVEPATLNKGLLEPQQGIRYSPHGSGGLDMSNAEILGETGPVGRVSKDRRVKTETSGTFGHKTSKQPKTPLSQQKPDSLVVSPITVDYSDSALDQLVDLKPMQPITASQPVTSGQVPVKFCLQGFLNGRLLSNDQDNYNYIFLSVGTVHPNQVYQPQVISCYRRNFINLHLCFHIDSPSTSMTIGEEKILRLRVAVSAITDKDKAEQVALLANEHRTDPKDARKAGDSLEVERIGTSHTINVAQCKRKSVWKVKKLQFKSATANSTNLVFQTYYRFLVQVFAETSTGSHVIEELASSPIIVRGRNPSFYHSKNDILIKAKSPGIAASFGHAGFAETLVSDDLAGQESNPTSEISTMATAQKNSMDGSAIQEMKQESRSPDLLLKPDTPCSERESARSDHTHTSDDENEPVDISKSKEENRVFQAPRDLQKILDSLSEKKSDKYHYFPILSVYYLPPINVVYFPHAAHHTESTSAPEDASTTESVNIHTPDSNSGNERKANSKVYFR